MRALKASVIIMGVLIVLGVIVLVFALVSRIGEEAADTETAGLPSQSPVDLVALGLPEGTAVRRVVPNGATVILHLAVPGQGEWIYIVPAQGAGTIVKIAVSAAE